MELQLDVEYDRQRRALVDNTTDAIEQAWLTRDLNDRTQFLDVGMTLVDGAAQAYCTLMSGYYNARAEAVTGTPTSHDIDASLFAAAEIRPDEPQFLDQAFGTVIFKLTQGKDFNTANEEAAASIRTLVKTHLQAIQVRAAWLWMATY